MIKKNILDELEVVLIIAALSCNILDLLTIKLTTIPELSDRRTLRVY